MKKKSSRSNAYFSSAERPGGGAVTGERLPDFGRYGGRHVGVDAEQLRRRLHAHLLRDGRAPIAALRHEPRVAEALHQHGPGASDAGGVPAGRGRLAGEAVAGHRRDHDVESVRGASRHARWDW